MLGSAEHKQNIAGIFNAVAGGYDSPVLRFFPLTADSLVSLLKPRQGWNVLGVATGTVGGVRARLSQV